MKKRVHIAIDEDLHDRVRAALRRLPAAPSFSGLVEELVAQMVPDLEALADAYYEGGKPGVERAAEANLGRAILGITAQASRKEPDG